MGPGTRSACQHGPSDSSFHGLGAQGKAFGVMGPQAGTLAVPRSQVILLLGKPRSISLAVPFHHCASVRALGWMAGGSR